jgi:hypothetical protein
MRRKGGDEEEQHTLASRVRTNDRISSDCVLHRARHVATAAGFVGRSLFSHVKIPSCPGVAPVSSSQTMIPSEKTSVFALYLADIRHTPKITKSARERTTTSKRLPCNHLWAHVFTNTQRKSTTESNKCIPSSSVRF